MCTLCGINIKDIGEKIERKSHMAISKEI